MAATDRGALPEDLRQARRQFQAWRKQRQTGQRIPKDLWALAVRLASTHGLSRTAAALRLDYYSLKKHIAADDQPVPTEAPAFVALPASLAVGKQALCELHNGAGVTLRVQLLGYDAADLEALTRRFWDAS